MTRDSTLPTTTSRWLRMLSWSASIAMLLLAVWILRRYISHIHWDDVATAWSQLPAHRIAWSVLAMLLSFSMLALFDIIASRIAVGQRLSTAMAAFAGVVTHGISNTLGFHAVTGTAVRYRIYRFRGIGAGDIARIISLAGLGVGLGFVVVITGALCREPQITQGWGRWPGLGLLLLLAIGLIWLARKPRVLTLGNWTLGLPNAPTAGLQMLIGAVEMLGAMLALYVLLPADIAPPFIDFLPIYVGAVVAGIVSHSPGGLGIFETIMLASFPAEARAELLAAMLCYRLTYSLLPFTLSCLALTTFEICQRGQRRKSAQLDGG